MLKIWHAAGAKNCAQLSGFINELVGIYGVSRDGTLKEKPMVIASLAEKRMKVGRGTGRGEPVPKMRAKLRSLMRPRDMFALRKVCQLK